ncbi:stage VI sporulation protein F [Brockia lithotrophica]|uniref:Stage VI sporulation protein F n=1 Tax=Brockia lithotrophica TaxID=933949 RepID=A0A660L4S5_9BACL|nr:stage VI sporulation protein F [Brockia lithotrophica]RKQ88418.1 stage VI sporulation protein F [Brockia lithotrophica]
MNLADLLQVLSRLGQTKVDPGQLKALAADLKAGDETNEEKLRNLVRTLTAALGRPLPPEKEEEIVAYLRNHPFRGMESIQRLLREKGVPPAPGGSDPEA